MEHAIASRAKAAVPWLSAAGGALGLLGLLGNLFNIEWLLVVIPGRPRMPLGTTLVIVIAAIGVALQSRHPTVWTRSACSRVIGAAVAVFGLLVLVDYVSAADLGMDWRLSISHLPGSDPGRISPFTAAAFVGLGGALLLLDVELPVAWVGREVLALAATFIALVSLSAHAYGAGVLYRFDGDRRVDGISVPIAIALSALSIATWLARPEHGLLRTATAPGPGGVVLRRLGITAVVAFPLAGGCLLWFVKTVEVRNLALIFAVGTVLSVTFALALLATTARVLERSAAAGEASRIRAEQLFDEAPEGIFVADLSGHYIDVNAAGCRLLGFAREEILQKSIDDLIPEGESERAWRERERLIGGAVQTADWRLRRIDGTYAPVEVTAKLLPDGRLQAFVRDISERLELKRKLLESRDFLQRVLESSTEYAIVAEDLTQRVVLWNEGARRTYGYELEEIRSKPSTILVAPAHLAEWSALHTRGMEQGKAEGQIVARRNTGSTFAAHVVCTRRLGPDGAPAGVLIVTRDLTVEQRYLAEHAFLSRVGVELAECLEYRETLECVTRLATGFLGDLVTIDLVRDRELQRTAAVERAASEEIAARLDSVREAGDPLSIVIETKQPLLLAQITRERRARFAGSAEHARVIESIHATPAMLVPLIARGQLLAVLSIARRDGTRNYGPDDLRLAMELARRAALTLDNVQLFERSRLQLSEKEVLLREIHHRVKNNLQVVSSLFSLQRERTHSAELKSLLDESRTRVESIALVHDQLYRSTDLAAIDFDAYLLSLVAAIRASYGAKCVEIEVRAKDVLLDVEQAVPCALVVCELVSNALKHAFDAAAPGKVWVYAKRDAQGHYNLEVGDDGCGIPANLDWTKSRSLGLRLVQGLARQLRATVALDRSNGTRFSLRFDSWSTKSTAGREERATP